jgi:transcriptional regulator with XRE-family HTH domain
MSPTATTAPAVSTDLRAELERRGMSQWRLAAATGIHPSQISRYVNGLQPSKRSAAKIAEALRSRGGES